jgi:hypothetical protein
MSSMYPPYGDTSIRRCWRCGGPLAPGEVYCGTCGEYNALTPANGPTAQAQPPASAPWGGPPPSPFYGGGQSTGQQWGQAAAPSAPNNFSGSMPYGPPQQPAYSGTPYDTPQQPGYSGSPYGAPTNSAIPYGPLQQPLHSAIAPAPMIGLQQNGMDGVGYLSPRQGSRFIAPMGFRQPPQQKRSPNTVLMIGIMILMVIFLGAGVDYFYVTSHPGKITTATPAFTPGPTPSTPPLFSDMFQNNNNGWDLSSMPGQYTVKVNGGSIVLEDDDHKLLSELVPGAKVYSNFELTVVASLSKGDQNNGYGVYIRGALDQNNDLATYYRFELFGDGSYGIYKGTVDANGNSQSNTLVNPTSNQAIQKQGGINHLAIVANGPSMAFIVNGQTLSTITDDSYTGGSLALFVSNLPAPTPAGAQATFSNLAVYPV